MILFIEILLFIENVLWFLRKKPHSIIECTEAVNGSANKVVLYYSLVFVLPIAIVFIHSLLLLHKIPSRGIHHLIQ